MNEELKEEKDLVKAEKAFLTYWWIAFILACPPFIFLFNSTTLVWEGRIPLLMAYVYSIYIPSLFIIFFLGRNLSKYLKDDKFIKKGLKSEKKSS